ncbi:MAG: MBL fold metallo-hydrolase, partial [Gemmatimonadaceae bacterium]
VFPVTFEELDARIDFSSIAAGERRSGRGYEVEAFDVQHPGGALGYRFRAPGSSQSIVYVSDNEVGAPEKYDSAPGWRESFVDFVRGATVLVHDTMYTTEEYDHHRGWGHSTFRDAVEVAMDAGVGTLVLFHHEPRRSDDELDQRIDECRALVRSHGGALQVLGAAEGLTLTV